MDVNRQAWTASAGLLVHPALHYVGLRTAKPFVQKGEPIVVDAIVTDLDGRALAGRRISLRAERLEWEQVDGAWTLAARDVQESSLDSGGEAVSARFEAREGGSWRILARVHDDAGRTNESELRVWVAGGRVPPRRGLEQEVVTLVPDRRSYAAGDVARVLVVAPFAPAQGLLTLRRSGLLREERFTIDGASRTLEVPIEEAYTPNLHVQVDLVGAAARQEGAPGTPSGGPGRPAFASGTIDLAVPPVSRTLSLTVSPRDRTLAPGGKTTIDLALRDAGGRPVASGEATLVVVDEAVLALTGYRLPDPLEVFYARREPGVSDHRLREQVLLASPGQLAGGSPHLGRAAGAAPVPRLRPGGRRLGRRRHGGAGAGSAQGGGRGEGARAHPRADRLLGARSLRRERPHRRLRPRAAARDPARQPHALPRDGRGGGRRPAVRLRRGDHHGPPAAHGATVAAALPELRRPLRAAGGGAEPDRPRAERRRRRARAQRDAHGRRGPSDRGGGERSRRGALPDGDRARGSGAPAGRRRGGRGGRRRRGRAARLHARDHRGVRDLRPARPGRDRAAGARTAGRAAAVRGPRADHVLDGALGPDRRRALPRRLPVRVLGAALLACARGGRAARRAGRLPGAGPAEAGRDRGGREARPRPPEGAAERRRRLRLLATRRRVVAVRLDPRRPRARAREREGLQRARPDARALAWLPACDRASRSRRLPRGRQTHPAVVRAVGAGAAGRRRPGPGTGAGARGRRRRAVVRGARLAAADAVEGRRLGGRAGGRPAAAGERRERDRLRRALLRLLRRRRLPAAPLGPARRRDPARGADRRPAGKRPHPEAGRGAAGAAPGRALDEHAGERLRAAGARPLLPGLREDDPRLRGARLAGRALRGASTPSTAARRSAST